jgi:hypothetical protein
MSVQLVSSNLSLTQPEPNLHNRKMGVQSATWDGIASIRFVDEQGKIWRAGFAQVLTESRFTALYTKTRVDEVPKAGIQLPVLDGTIKPDWKPFYYSKPKTGGGSQEISIPANAPAGLAGAQTATVTMWDEPESEYDWCWDNDLDDTLEEVEMHLRFSTWVAARDMARTVRGNPAITVLAEWSVLVKRRFKIKKLPALVPSPDGPQLDKDEVVVEVENPTVVPEILRVPHPQQLPDGIWTQVTANSAFEDRATERTKKAPVSQSIQGRKLMLEKQIGSGTNKPKPRKKRRNWFFLGGRKYDG